MLDHSPTEMEPAYERDEELHANGKATGDSDTSDFIPDRLLAEKELAHERVVRFDVTGLATGDSSMATISYEDAIERELEYQKRENLSLSQPPFSSSFLLMPSHVRAVRFDVSGLATSDLSMATISFEEAIEMELEYQKRKNLSLLQPPFSSSFLSMPSHARLTGVMRKDVAQDLPGPGANLVNGQKMSSNPLQDRQAPSQKFNSQQPPMQELHHQYLLRQQSNGRQPLQQSQQFKPQFSSNQQLQQRNTQGQQPLGQRQQSRQMQPNQQPPQHATHFRQPSFWCNICQLNCNNASNLKAHRRGKKHITKLEEISAGKKSTPVYNNDMLWCKECNVPCMNEVSLAQHRSGKKHMIQALQANNGAPGFGKNMTHN